MGQVVTAEKIKQAKEFYQLHFGYNLFNEEGQCNIKKLKKQIVLHCDQWQVYGRGPPLFWVKDAEITERIKAGMADKTNLPPHPLSLRSGFATGDCSSNVTIVTK